MIDFGFIKKLKWDSAIDSNLNKKNNAKPLGSKGLDLNNLGSKNLGSKNLGSKFKPVKTFKADGKTIKVFNEHPIPSKARIKKLYENMPDDPNVPVKFMTREQYLKSYVHNQEQTYGIQFDKQSKQAHMQNKRPKYETIRARYTTKQNPYFKPAVIIFNDPSNQQNLEGTGFEWLAWHEFGHKKIEKNGIELDYQTEEEFCDYLADRMVNNPATNPRQVFDEFMENRSQNNLKSFKVYNDGIVTDEIIDSQIAFDNFSNNYFTKSYNPDEMSAAQKFGRHNIDRLKRLGQGRDRVVYDLGDGNVLKVAKNPGGIAQNRLERESEDMQELGMDYAVTKKSYPLSPENKQILKNITEEFERRKEEEGAYHNTQKQRQILSGIEAFREYLDPTGYYLNFNFMPMELLHPSQWGQDEDGNFVLQDMGALADYETLSKHKIKDFEHDDYELQGWNTAKWKRLKYKDKGKYDPQTELRKSEYTDYELHGSETESLMKLQDNIQ